METDIGEFSLPRLKQMVHFRLPMPVLDVTSPGNGEYYCSAMRGAHWVLVQIEPARHRGRFVGEIPGQSFRTPLFLEQGAAFVSSARSEYLVVRSGKTESRVPVGDEIIWASRCGDRIIATESKKGTARTVWLDRTGKVDDTLADSERTLTPTCSSDGALMFMGTFGPKSGLRRCDQGGCRQIFEGSTRWAAVSPDDSRLAFLESDNRGHVIRWIAADGRGGGREIVGVDTGCAARLGERQGSLGRGTQRAEGDLDGVRYRLGAPDRPYAGREPPTAQMGLPTPRHPSRRRSRIETSFRGQLRFLPEKYLPGRSPSR